MTHLIPNNHQTRLQLLGNDAPTDGRDVVRARRVLITVQNLEPEEILGKECFEDVAVRRAVYQIERAPTTGMLHAHVYMEFNCRVTLATVRNWFRNYPDKWIMICRGSCKQCYDYCTKQETRVDGPYEFGMRWEAYKDWELMWLEAEDPAEEYRNIDWTERLPDNIYEMMDIFERNF